jgi:predicted Zn-ribbon and HTH transcriptional regulator
MAERAEPVERSETPRQAIQRLLGYGPHTAHDLALALRLRERDVVEHLEHLQRSLRRGPRRLVVEPPRCRACGYAFPGRRRLSAPGACPACREERVEPPVFGLEGEA